LLEFANIGGVGVNGSGEVFSDAFTVLLTGTLDVESLPVGGVALEGGDVDDDGGDTVVPF